MKDNQQLQILDLEELTVELSNEESETIVGGFCNDKAQVDCLI